MLYKILIKLQPNHNSQSAAGFMHCPCLYQTDVFLRTPPIYVEHPISSPFFLYLCWLPLRSLLDLLSQTFTCLFIPTQWKKLRTKQVAATIEFVGKVCGEGVLRVECRGGPVRADNEGCAAPFLLPGSLWIKMTTLPRLGEINFL